MHKGSISFSSEGSQDPDGYITARRWYIDGVFFSSWSSPNYSVALNPGEHSRTITIGLEVRDDDNTWSVRTNRTITISLSGRTEYYLTDHLGSVRTTIDQNGFVLGYDDFDPFGNVLPGRSSNFATPNDDNKFTGHERDTEGNLNLDFTPARIYDGEIAMFYGIDALLEFASPYSYVGGNPINLVDLTGLSSSDPDSTKQESPMMEVQGQEVVVTAQREPQSA
jgi:RHS repeat-associated protein